MINQSNASVIKIMSPFTNYSHSKLHIVTPNLDSITILHKKSMPRRTTVITFGWLKKWYKGD